MPSFDQTRIRNTIIIGFASVLVLGIFGYANAVNVQLAVARKNRGTAATIAGCIVDAKDLGRYGFESSANTGEYVHTGDMSYREFEREADEQENAIDADLRQAIDGLPQNGELERKLGVIVRIETSRAEPDQNEAIALEDAGKQAQARAEYSIDVVPTDNLINIRIDDLISALRSYQKASQIAADKDRMRAIYLGWLIQGVIFVISLLIATAVSVALGRDIRKILDVQDRLRTSESRLRTALTGAPLILFATDVNGVFTLMEGQVLDNLGVRGEDMVGLSILDLYPNRDDVMDNIRRALAGECFTTQVCMGERIYSTTYNPQHDKDDRVTGVIGVSTDITERSAAENEAERLLCDLEESNQELAHAYDTTIAGWSAALDLRDRETEGHSRRVTELSIAMARAMGMSDQQIIQIRRGALLHDIGKMGIPDGILLKPGSLTEEEWVIMRKHPEYAYDLLKSIDFLAPALDIPLYHHEKWDGTGYPHKLSGTGIPLAARIFAIVDVYDALNSDRPYRAAWPIEKTLAHIRSLAGSHFDPDLVPVFESVLAAQCPAARLELAKAA